VRPLTLYSCIPEKMSTYWPLRKTATVAGGCKWLKINWWSSGDSNPGPPHCERGALPN
jgi:hypothetical protein